MVVVVVAAVIPGIFWERNFTIGTPFILGTPQDRSFRGSACLVLLVVLVARNGTAEFYNWHSIYNCEVYITSSSCQSFRLLLILEL